MKIIVIALIASVLVASCTPQTAEDQLAVQLENCTDYGYGNVVMDNLPLGEGLDVKRIKELVKFSSQSFADKLVAKYKYRDEFKWCRYKSRDILKSLYSSPRQRTIDSPFIKEVKKFQKELENYSKELESY